MAIDLFTIYWINGHVVDKWYSNFIPSSIPVWSIFQMEMKIEQIEITSKRLYYSSHKINNSQTEKKK